MSPLGFYPLRATKNPILRSGQPAKQNCLVAQINSNSHSCSKTRMGSNRFWHIVSVVKERLYASLSCRVANNNLIRLPDSPYLSTLRNLLKSLFHTSPQLRSHPALA